MITLLPSGKIIDGWQRIESQVIIPNGVTEISIALAANGVKTWFDDVRAYPADGNMESYVYHNITHRLMAKLDANNFAIFYEYDKEGNLIRIKRETEMGIVTLKEVRQNSIKYKRKADGTY
jgi:YD repeat-containing protein